MTKEELKRTPGVFWHGSPSGDLRGSAFGLHFGTYEAAKQALEARIGIPAKGEWDGTREYGVTLLAGKETLRKLGPGVNTGFNVDAPEKDYYPTGKASFSDSTPVSPKHKPNIFPARIVGRMTNHPYTPHEDFKANGYMKAQLKRGIAKSGYYYTNDGEDYGSISVVVPGASHIECIKTFP